MAETKDLKRRLTRQLAARGVDDAASMAIGILKKRGDLNGDGELTAHGRKRQAMGAAGRAIDRAAKASGKPPSAFQYNPKTNRATVKKDG